MGTKTYKYDSADSIPDTWKCSKCGVLPISEFYRCRHQGKYWRWKCKQCQKDSRKKRYRADPKASHEASYAWRKENPEKWKLAQQRSRDKHGYKYKQQQKKVCADRREEVLQHYGGDPPKCAVCSESHREFLVIDHVNNDGAEQRKKLKRVTAGFYRWIVKNNFPDDLRVLCQACNVSSPSHNLSELIQLSFGEAPSPYIKYRARKRLEVLNHYSPDKIQCACCSDDDVSKLVIDHVKGGGREQRREIGRDAATFHRWLIKNSFPDGYRVLCHNCNHSYGSYGYCPHQVSPSQ